MNILKPTLVSAGVVAAMLAASAWAYPHMPDTPIAVHWGLNGQPNGYAGKGEALLAMPIITLLMALVFAALPSVMPKAGRLERSAQPYLVTWLGTLAVLLVVHAVVIAKGLGAQFDVMRPMAVSVGLLLALIGNFMGKIRYNYAMGVRTPWTLSSERVWDKTHRFGGRWMMAGGIALALIALIPGDLFDDQFLGAALIVCAIGPALAAVVYSYLVSRKLEGAA